MNGNLTKLKGLKLRNVDLNAINYDRRTPLHFAAKYGRLDSVQYLASIGVNLSPLDRWGATPLNYAADYPDV